MNKQFYDIRCAKLCNDLLDICVILKRNNKTAKNYQIPVIVNDLLTELYEISGFYEYPLSYYNQFREIFPDEMNYLIKYSDFTEPIYNPLVIKVDEIRY